ncbi:MAG: hypothetical protein C5B49_05390 [Bdellovibrio sp.]|nr:MAG: hypothetical protein C5B49_05390 [Bdellovibrio sp.]
MMKSNLSINVLSVALPVALSAALPVALLVVEEARGEESMALDQFLSEVHSQNLSIKVEEAAAKAATEGASEVAIPPPMVGVTQLKDQSGQANGFELSQTIPFPTKLSSDHAARILAAEAKTAMRNVKEREVLANAKLLYFKLWKAQERTMLLREKKGAIALHLKLAQAATRSDSFLKIHLIKAEGEQDLLENEITQSEQERRERQIAMAEILDRNAKNFRPVAREVPLSPLPRPGGLEAISQIKVQKFQLEAAKARESEARSSWFPDLNLRYREMGGTPMNPKFSEVMIGVSLPFLLFWEPKAASRQAAAERMQFEFLLAQEERQIETKRESLLSKAESLKVQIEQFHEKLLPRAEKRMRLIHNMAPRDMETLQDHREAMEAFPDLKLKALELREQYEEVIAELAQVAALGGSAEKSGGDPK